MTTRAKRARSKSTPLADKFREWVQNPCHGRIAAPMEFVDLVSQVETLENENRKLVAEKENTDARHLKRSGTHP